MKTGQGVLLIVIGILVGILASNLYTNVQYPMGNERERISPANHVAEKNIEVYSDRVVIKLDNPKWASFADTNSMDPIFDAGNHAIQVVPRSPDDIAVGDIISYQYNGKIIIHRVIEKNIDGDGWYFIAKGDNNPEPDPLKVRFEDVTRVVVAVIY
jgi:signal peptidase I